jgi:nicotinate-nucleotide--dimethylbenzimidazole phosphoribosyltransferase
MNHLLPTVNDLRDLALTQAVRAALDNKTKPLGSLGRLESLALQLG